MRDPYSPILASAAAPTRRRPGPPPPPRPRDPFDPLRALGSREEDPDPLGLDRRSRERETSDARGLERGDAPLTERDPGDAHGTRSIVAAAHRPLRAVMALQAGRRCAWVDVLSVAPDGLLVRAIELDEHSPGDLRRRLALALPRLADLLGSSLATVGTFVLGPGLVAGLSEWGQRSARSGAAPTVRLVVAGGDPEASAWSVEAELRPLVDPSPKVLALRLPRAEVARILDSLAGPPR